MALLFLAQHLLNVAIRLLFREGGETVLFNQGSRLLSGRGIAGRNVAAGPLRAEPAVPADQEGLREVGLDAPALVVHVVVDSVVPENLLERIPRERVAAVVIDRFHGAEAEEDHSSAQAHPRELVCQTGADGVHEQALEGMVVQRAERVGDVETVVTGMESSVEPLALVHEAVQEVLPGIEDKDGDAQTHGRNQVPIRDFNGGEPPILSGRDSLPITTTLL